MTRLKTKVKDFFRKNGMDPDDIDIEQSCNVFLEEMRKGLSGEISSLAMLPTYIETERQIPRNQPVIVMDAGGTNFRVATVCFEQDGTTTIEDFEVYPMPGMKQEVSKEEFFNTMASYVEQIINRSSSIGFCFSYPIEMFPNKDGRVTHFSKEIQASQVVGEMIGENLNAAISASGRNSRKRMVLLNDIVATLLAGRADSSGRTFSSHIGFILGTGTNCSYVEQNANITKAKDLDLAKSQIVNVESGGFGKAPQGTIDKNFDESSVSPGTYTFEKMISGAYLGPLCLQTVQTAAQDGLFSKASAERLKKIDEMSTKDVSDFLSSPEAGTNLLSSAVQRNDEDAMTLYCLVDMLVERAAKLTAINLSSVAIKTGKGQNPCRPVCIVAEGTTFYHLKSLKEKVQYYLKQYLEDQKGIYYEIVSVENATLIGAAIAGLTN